MKIAKYTGRKVGKVTVDEVAEAEVNKTIADMLAQSKSTAVKEDASENGDIVNIDFEGFIENEAFQGGKGEHYDLELGSGSFIPGFEEQLVGHKAGEDVDVNVNFPENYHAENLKGKPALFKCHIHEVKQKKEPVLDDAFAQSRGCKDVADLKERVKQSITAQKTQQAGNAYLDKLLGEIISESEIELDPANVEKTMQNAMKYYTQQVAQMGMSLEQYCQATGSSKEEFMTKVRDDAEFSCKVQVIFDVVAKEQNLSVSEEDLNKELNNIKKYYHLTDEQFEKFAAQAKDEVKDDMLKGLCSGYLLDNND